MKVFLEVFRGVARSSKDVVFVDLLSTLSQNAFEVTDRYIGIEQEFGAFFKRVFAVVDRIARSVIEHDIADE